MPVRAVVDTHTVIWYMHGNPRLSQTARSAIADIELAGYQIGVSAITLAEIVYLIEKERIPDTTYGQVMALLQRVNALLVEIPIDHQVVDAMRQIERKSVPDMPDRLIAATALFLGVPVISRDGKIRLSTVATIW